MGPIAQAHALAQAWSHLTVLLSVHHPMEHQRVDFITSGLPVFSPGVPPTPAMQVVPKLRNAVRPMMLAKMCFASLNVRRNNVVMMAVAAVVARVPAAVSVRL
jgi:hypothetical protein